MTLGARHWQALGGCAAVAVTPAEALDDAAALVADEVSLLDVACSRFRDDSELVRLNGLAGRWVPVGPLLFGALAASLRAARLTGGAVDPTIGRGLRLAGYDRDAGSLCPLEAPARLEAAPGWRCVELDPARRAVRTPPRVELDLGAIGKAYGADRAAARVHAELAVGCAVALSGDCSAAGPPPDAGWPIGIAEDHRAALAGAGGVVALRGGALATSSTRVRRWQRAGRELNHLIDPSTGAPVEGPWRTATVAAATCVEANAAATAALVLGAGAPAWLASKRLPARLVAAAGGVCTVGGWPAAERAA